MNWYIRRLSEITEKAGNISKDTYEDEYILNADKRITTSRRLFSIVSRILYEKYRRNPPRG